MQQSIYPRLKARIVGATIVANLVLGGESMAVQSGHQHQDLPTSSSKKTSEALNYYQQTAPA